MEGIFVNGTAHFFTFSLIKEGASKKVLPLKMPLEPICNKNFCFNDKKCIL
jgi:hypothetical protein